MHIKAIVSAVALSTALGFGGVAYAQDAALPTSIGEQQLSEADAQRVKVFCEDLQTSENQAVGTTDDELTETDSGSATDDTATPPASGGSDDTSDDGDTDTDTDTDSDSSATGTASESGDSDTAAVGSVDTDLITIEACTEAGFITAP